MQHVSMSRLMRVLNEGFSASALDDPAVRRFCGLMTGHLCTICNFPYPQQYECVQCKTLFCHKCESVNLTRDTHICRACRKEEVFCTVCKDRWAISECQ